MTGMALGTAILGMRPIMIHHRMDFAVLSMEPIVNQAAKWHYMYGGHSTAPLTIRMIIGRGWGQGPQHSQSLQAWFAHVPGLQVVMPATASDAKGLLAAAVLGETPTIVLEHRWLYELQGDVPSELLAYDIGKAAVRRTGTDVTLVSASYMTIESLKAAEVLEQFGVSAEVVDLRTISPLDTETIRKSVTKTGRLVVADTGQVNFGIGAEVISVVVEDGAISLLAPPSRIGLPFAPTPTTPALADHYYPTSREIVSSVMRMLGLQTTLPGGPFPTSSPGHSIGRVHRPLLTQHRQPPGLSVDPQNTVTDRFSVPGDRYDSGQTSTIHMIPWRIEGEDDFSDAQCRLHAGVPRRDPQDRRGPRCR